jgi:hypothetical protein
MNRASVAICNAVLLGLAAALSVAPAHAEELQDAPEKRPGNALEAARTGMVLPVVVAPASERDSAAVAYALGGYDRLVRPAHDARYWQRMLGHQNFAREDELDEADFNRKLWHGIMGQQVPYPTLRHRRPGGVLVGDNTGIMARHMPRRPAAVPAEPAGARDHGLGQ